MQTTNGARRRAYLRRAPLAVAALAASLTVAAGAEAQFVDLTPWSGDRVYQFYGCDYSHADVFGPGPRACASALIVAKPRVHEPPLPGIPPGYLEIHGQVTSDFFTSWVWIDFMSASPPVVVNPMPVIGPDLIHAPTCVDFVCAPGVGTVPVRLAPAWLGWRPNSIEVRVRYFDASTPPGSFVAWYPGAPELGHVSIFTLQAVPEPSTVALVSAGLLAVAGTALRRRRATTG